MSVFPETNGVSECWKYFSEAKKDDKILFGWAVCKSCFTSILYNPKKGDDTDFYGTKNLSDHLKNCRRTLHPHQLTIISKVNRKTSKYNNQTDLMKENLLKTVVCGGTSFSFLEIQGFHDTISHAIQVGVEYGSSNLLGPGSGFIWVTWIQGQQ